MSLSETSPSPYLIDIFLLFVKILNRKILESDLTDGRTNFSGQNRFFRQANVLLDAFKIVRECH